MADLYRVRLTALLGVLLLAVAMFFPVPAKAAIITQYCTTVVGACGASLGWYISKAEACGAHFNDAKARTSPLTGSRLDAALPSCKYCVSGSGGDNFCLNPANAFFAPYGSRVVGTADASACDAMAGKSAGETVWKGKLQDAPIYFCDGADGAPASGLPAKPHCAFVIQSGGSFSVTFNGVSESLGVGKYTGEACAMTVDGDGIGATPSTAKSSTGTGVPGETSAVSGSGCKGFLGTVNGVVVCIPADNTSGSVTSSTTAGTTTSSTGSTTSVVTKNTTTCDAATCTTTTVTTTTPTGGTPTTSGSTTAQSKSEFCKANPLNPSCADASSGEGTSTVSTFGGSCVTETFACEGDAAMCATAKATNLLNCSLHTDKLAPEVVTYNDSKAAGTATGIQSTTVAISESSFDTTNSLNVSASCITDRTVVVSGKSITLPFSSICPYLGWLGNLLLAVSFLSAIVIVGKPSS